MRGRSVVALGAATVVAVVWFFAIYPLSFHLIPSTANVVIGVNVAIGGLTTVGVFVAFDHEGGGRKTGEEEKAGRDEVSKHTKETLGITDEPLTNLVGGQAPAAPAVDTVSFPFRLTVGGTDGQKTETDYSVDLPLEEVVRRSKKK